VVLPLDVGEAATTLGAPTGVASRTDLVEALADLRPGRAAEALAAAWAGLPSTSRCAEIVELIEAHGGAARGFGPTAVLAWSEPGARGPGPREAVAAALAPRGLRLTPVRVDLRGLEVEEAAARV
jgi:hypothetical protein